MIDEHGMEMTVITPSVGIMHMCELECVRDLGFKSMTRLS